MGLRWCLTTAHRRSGLLPSLADAWLWHRAEQSLQWGMPSGTNKLEVEFQNGTSQHQKSTLERESKNGTLQLSLTLERVTTNFCLAKRSFKSRKWLSFTYSLGTFQTGVLALDSGAWASLCKPFKSKFSIPYSFMVLLGITLTGSQSHTFWGLISPVRGSRAWRASCVAKTPVSQRKSLYFWDPSWLWILTAGVLLVCLFCKITSLPLLPILTLPFYPLLWKVCLSGCHVFPQKKNILYVVVNVLCHGRRWGSSYASILKSVPTTLLLIYS